jgi:predicted component of type VI protein secretion system
MADAKLKIDGKERTISKGVTPIGRTSDNFIAFPEDANVSRYHAEIESRGDDFYLIDLGSSNGTTLNGEPVKSEKLLQDGDVIVLGGTSRIEFLLESERKSEAAASSLAAGGAAFDGNSETADSSDSDVSEIGAENESPAKSSLLLNVAGAVVGLAVVSVFAAGIYFYTKSPPPCQVRAAIIQPESGDVIRTETDIKVEAENTDCASRAVFVLGDMVIASSDLTSYDATIDPREFPEFADGATHSLRLIFEDEEGRQVGQPAEVLLAFDTLATPTPTPDEIEIVEDAPKPKPTAPRAKEVSLIETQEMAKRLINQFPGQNYRFDKQFLQEVQKRANEYKTDGYYTKARQYRDVINESFVKEQNLQPPLGFILAMSRSKFSPEKQTAGEGLWQMSNDFVTENAYNGTCENKDLSEASQKCAAIAAAAYLKVIVLNIFEGDVIYGAAAFGMSPLEAAEWKASLPENRADFWRNIKNAQQREQIIRFFAAGIVAENPQKFDLRADAPISELYRNLM